MKLEVNGKNYIVDVDVFDIDNYLISWIPTDWSTCNAANQRINRIHVQNVFPYTIECIGPIYEILREAIESEQSVVCFRDFEDYIAWLRRQEQ